MIKRNLDISWKRVLIIWNWGYKNLWDELILLWTVNLLLEQWKQVYISTNNPERLKQFFSQFINVDDICFVKELPHWFRSFFAFTFSKYIFDLVKYFQVDSVILWWWEIITEENPKSYIYWLVSIWPILLKNIFKKSSLYLMWWVQIPEKKSNKRLFDFLLKRVNFAYLRDFDCVDNLKKYGFQNVDFFMDTSIFAYDWEDFLKSKITEKKSKSNKNNEKIIAINLNKNWEKFFEDVKKDIIKYQKEWFKFVYIPIAKWWNTYYQDIQYFYKLKEGIANLEISVLDWEYDFWKFILELSKCEKVICTRLHLFLVSSFLWLDTMVFPYQKKINKMKDVLKKMKITSK